MMKDLFPPFKLERYFAQYEFKVRYLLSASDCEGLALHELLALADADSLARWDALTLGYTESQGLPALREEVARMSPGLSADDVLILAPEEGIFIAMQTLLNAGDHVICVAPAYQSLYEITRSCGYDLTPWHARPSEGKWSFDLDELKRSINPRTKLLVINFPHNPTGYLPSRQELDAIVSVAAQNGLRVFSDEMYRGLEYQPGERLPAMCGLYERGISLSGMSKAYALPGLRIGWLATRDGEIMSRWMHAKDYTTICSSAPSEVLALMGLRARQAIIARNLQIIQTNLTAADQFFAEFAAGFTWRKPRAGSVAFAQWLGGQPVEQWCQAILDAQGVMIVPGSLFDAEGNYFRLGLGRRNFVEALEHVREHLHNTSGCQGPVGL
ncbi:MAG TPA: aminotransferase class I/II-fold pyridoxal phosphate-dependent enzyme [Anaerolineae bacterium]|jgi:aspartate/methionine/tyrosine aminotransferase